MQQLLRANGNAQRAARGESDKERGKRWEDMHCVDGEVCYCDHHVVCLRDSIEMTMNRK